MTLKEVSSLNNVNDDTYKCVIFEYFFTKIIFIELSLLTLIRGVIFGLFFNDTLKALSLVYVNNDT